MRHVNTQARATLTALLEALKTTLVLSLAAALTACTSVPQPTAAPTQFFHDSHFVAAADAATGTDPLAMSPAMRAYAEEHLQPETQGLNSRREPRQALLTALYQNHKLRLKYDDTHTRTAAQAFEQRAGNCLSLVLMTAAFAKHLGLPVTYQAVDVDETYERRGGLHLSSSHVNLVLQRPPMSLRTRSNTGDADLVVDFLPGREVASVRVRPISESSLLAMFHNNRAADMLAAGQPAAAYWWARAAVVQAPDYVPALNTLGVVYDRAGLREAAEQAYRQVLLTTPHHVAALSNFVSNLRQQGRPAEAEPAARLLARLQQQPPFQAFDEGRTAMAALDYERAKRLFDQELEHQPHQSEVHHWAALANWHLGNHNSAARHLKQARDFSSTVADHERFSAKLESLRTRVH